MTIAYHMCRGVQYQTWEKEDKVFPEDEVRCDKLDCYGLHCSQSNFFSFKPEMECKLMLCGVRSIRGFKMKHVSSLKIVLHVLL